MKIHKYAHACLLIEKGGVKILIDPGTWNTLPDATEVDTLLITHEHQDHCDIEQVKALVERMPTIRVITHAAVGEKLAEAGIAFEAIEPGTIVDVKGVSVETFGTEHASIYGPSPCRNTGFLVGEELFIPGDALHDVPTKPVRLLALPTGGPWMKLSEAIDYAKQVKPSVAFAIHDAMHTDDYAREFIPFIMSNWLKGEGIEFVDLASGASKEL